MIDISGTVIDIAGTVIDITGTAIDIDAPAIEIGAGVIDIRAALRRPERRQNLRHAAFAATAPPSFPTLDRAISGSIWNDAQHALAS